MTNKIGKRIEDDDINYIAVARSNDATERRGLRVELPDGREIAIFRYKSALYAVSNVCPHQHISAISDGIIENGCVICPMHGWTFSLNDGQCVNSKASLETYRIIERDGYVYAEDKTEETATWMKW